VTILIATSWPGAGVAGADLLMGVALLLAAPSAVTAVVLSRASGGMIVPSALIVLVSTAMSLANTIALLAYFGQSDLTLQAFLLVAVSSGSLLLPVLAVHVARQRCPIVVAKAAEDHAAIAVGALAVFAVLSFQQITLDSFYPAGLIALAVGISLRLLSLRMARHASLYGIDDYFSMSYPNIFLVIILAGLLGNETVLNVATWFLLPMFALSPLDDRLIRRLQKAQPHFGLLAYLRINHRHARAAETGANPSTHDADEFPSTLMLKQQRSEANTSAH
jgi:predicted Na+-dependent transporter